MGSQDVKQEVEYIVKVNTGGLKAGEVVRAVKPVGDAHLLVRTEDGRTLIVPVAVLAPAKTR